MTNWKAYNEYQLTEYTSYAKILQELIQKLEFKVRFGQVGKPRTSMRTVLISLFLKNYFSLSYRRLRSLLPIMQHYFAITKLPQYNTLCDHMNKKELLHYLKRLVVLSSIPVKDFDSEHALIDSTGLSTSNRSHHYLIRLGITTDRKQFRKLHAISTRKYNVITSAEVSGPYHGDNRYFNQLFEETIQNFPVRSLSGDTLYCSKSNVAMLSQRGITPYLKPSKMMKVRRAKSKAWREMLVKYKSGDEVWFRGYNLRSNVEASFGALKRKFGYDLKSRKFLAQTNEGLIKVVNHNITQLIRASMEEPVKI